MTKRTSPEKVHKVIELRPLNVKLYQPGPRDHSWVAANKKMLEQADRFCQHLEAWCVEKQARELFAESLGVASWSDLRKAMRSLVGYETFIKSNISIGKDSSQFSSHELYLDEHALTFLELGSAFAETNVSVATVNHHIRMRLELFFYTSGCGWLSATQLRWARRQLTLLSKIAGQNASALLSRYWSLPEDMFMSQVSNNITTIDQNACLALHRLLSRTAVEQHQQSFWVRASDAKALIKQAPESCHHNLYTDAVSLVSVLQLVDDTTLIMLKQKYPLRPSAIVASTHQLGKLCRAGWWCEDSHNSRTITLNHPIRATWQALLN